MNTNCSFNQKNKNKKKKKNKQGGKKTNKKKKTTTNVPGGERVSTTGWMTWLVCFQKPHQIVNSI